MLLTSRIAEEKERVIEGLKKRNYPEPEQTIEGLISLDTDRRQTQTELDNTLAENNRISKQIGMLMREGKVQEAEKVKKRTSELKRTGKELSDKLNNIENQLRDLLYNVPNIPHDRVPVGTHESDNEIVHEEGEIPELPSDALPHWELGKKYDIIDFDLGNKITGAGFPVYKGKGARLQRALVNFFLDQALEEGYAEIQPPVIINEDSGLSTGQLPDKEGQMYRIVEDNLYLIPTAEVPITNIYRDVILEQQDLPVRNVGYTPCFRREAGSWGAHVRGLNRLHQFDKVEIVQIAHPDKSYEILEEMRDFVETIIRKLALKYRAVILCGGDLGFTSALTYDMEVFSAAQEKWLEVSSISNFETFQANRLKLRYRDARKKTQLLHTLNGSALALPRIVAAILENNQTENGIKIPEILVPYTGFEIID